MQPTSSPQLHLSHPAMALSQSKRRRDRWVDCNTRTTVSHCCAVVGGKKVVSYPVPCNLFQYKRGKVTWKKKLTVNVLVGSLLLFCILKSRDVRLFCDCFSSARYQEKKTRGETSTGGDGGWHVFSHCGWVDKTESKDEIKTSIETFLQVQNYQPIFQE